MSGNNYCLSAKQKFALGALGGVLPLLAGLLAIDLATIIDNIEKITPGVIMGFFIKTVVIIVLGGVISCLNKDVNNSLSLVQLGIAAPALITSYIHSTDLEKITQRPQQLSSFAFVSRAFAAESNEKDRNIILAQGFFSDTLRGVLQSPAQILHGPLQPQTSMMPEAARQTATVPSNELGSSRGHTYAIKNKITGICIERSFDVNPGEIQANFPNSIYTITFGSCSEN